MVSTMAEAKIEKNPFVGPRSFQTGERLYGRARESVELVDLLIAERIVLLYSPSGAGKSSLINAVVLPAMQKEGFMLGPVLRVNMEPPADCTSTPGFNRYSYSLMRSLEDSLPEQEQRSAGELAGMSLEQYLSDYRSRASAQLVNYAEKGSLLLVIDQFEEVLRINAADQPAKQAFFEQLGSLLRHDRSLWALIALREDYLAAIQPYTRPIPNRLSVAYRLDFLDAVAAIDAIQGPCKDSGVAFEDAAAKQLVENLRRIRVQKADGSTEEQSGPYVEPVQLQVVCHRLWEKASEKKVVTVEDVSRAGNIDDALSDYYSEHVAETAAASGVGERQIREWFDRKLITPYAIRSQVLMEPESSSGLPNRAIKLLQEAYLVRAENRGHAVWFELAHDRLTRPVRQNNSEWFAQHLSVFQRQADLWNLQGKPEALILTGQAYLDAERWVKENPEVLAQPGPEKEFFEACREKHRIVVRERRMNTIIRWTALGMFALALAAAYLGYQANKLKLAAQASEQTAQRLALEAVAARDEAKNAEKRADESALIAEVRGLVAQAISKLNVDPSVSVTLALQAIKKFEPIQSDQGQLAQEVQDALRQALPATRVEQVLRDPSVDPNGIVSHEGTVWSAVFDQAGDRVITAGDEGKIKVWDRIEGKLLQELTVFEPATGSFGVTYITLSPDGKTLAAAAGNGRVVLYVDDGKSFKLSKTIATSDYAVWALAFSPDGTRLAIGGAGGFARVETLDDPFKSLSLENITTDIRAIAFSPDGAQVATGDSAGVVKLWDSGSGRNLAAIDAQSGAVGGVAFSPNGKILATAGADDRIINLWVPTREPKKLLSITGHRDGINAIVFTLDGTQLISASSDRTIRFWDTASGRPGAVLNGHEDQVYGLALSPKGDRIVTTGKDRTARIWNIAPEGSREYFTFNMGSPIHAIAISPDGSRLAEASEDKTVQVFATGSERLFYTLQGHNGPVTAVTFSHDGTRILTGSKDGTAKTWSSADGSELKTLSGHEGGVQAVAFNHDDSRAATASEDQTVKIWDPATGNVELTLNSSWGSPLALDYSPDGSILAVGYSGSQVVLWDTTTGKPLKVLSGHSDAVRAVAFRPPDGSLLASAGDDGSIRLWKGSGDSIGTKEPSLRPRGDAVLALAFTQDGKFMVSGGADGIGTIWNMDVRQEAFHIFGQTDRIYTVAISPPAGSPSPASPDQTFLFTGGRDGTLRMHAFSLDKLVEVAGKRSNRQFTEEECRQYLNAACPADAVIAAAPAEGATASNLNKPGQPPSSPEADLKDADSSGGNGPVIARNNDNYELNRYERPFSSDMSIYYPDVDIKTASMGRTPDWVYFTITLAGPRGSDLMGYYAIEIDMNGDGRGDHLVTTLAPGSDWSTSGVRIWMDQNRDVGNQNLYYPDPPQAGDGFETLVFDQGSGDQPDLAWSRISPTDPNTIQIAVRRAVFEAAGRGTDSFVWTAWASRDPFQPAWFDYNDHFTRQEVGAPVKDNPEGVDVLKNLAGLDDTCRYAFGIATQGNVFCKP
jgi:WD40 repeat protein